LLSEEVCIQGFNCF